MPAQISLTGLLAAYGAILSSIGLGWNLYRDLHDRAHLRVVAHLRRVAPSTLKGQWFAVSPHIPLEGASEKLFVFIDVTNVGRRPVKWVGWGGKSLTPVNGRPSFSVIPLSLPKMLNEGESHSEFTDEVKRFHNVKEICIWTPLTSTGIFLAGH